MEQQINLYQKEQKRKEMVSFMQMVQAVSALGIVLLLLTIYQTYNYFSQKRTLTSLQQKQAEINKQLKLTEGKLPVVQTRDQLLSEIKAEEEEKKFREQVLATLNNLQISRTGGFSKYMKALAKETVSGLWLTRFDFRGNGEFIALMGKALKPDQVPKFLEGLSRQVVFAGKTFQVFKLSADPKTEHINFVLETAPELKL